MYISLRKAMPFISFMLLLALTGCSIFGSKSTPAPAATEDINLAYTQAAQTIVAELTLNAPPTATPEPPAAQVVLPTSTPTLEPLPPTSTPLPTNTPLPSDTPAPTNTPVPPTETPQEAASVEIVPVEPVQPEMNFVLAFQDDFSYTRGWPIMKGEYLDIHSRYTKGGYAVTNLTIHDAVWSVRSTPYDDVRVEVTASRMSGPRDGYYGIVCRHENGSNYYLFYVGSDGRYGIAKQKGGELIPFEEKQDITGAVKTGNGINTITADCIGSTLTLWANGVMLLTVEDTDFSAGSVGVAVGTRSITDMEVLFDDFYVYVPE